MGMSHSHGSIAPGRKANLIVTRPLQSLAQIPYQYTTPWIKSIIIAGKAI